MSKEKKENVRVSTKTLNKVRKHLKKTKQSIGGFYDLAVEEKIQKDNFLEQAFPPNQESWLKDIGVKPQ